MPIPLYQQATPHVRIEDLSGCKPSVEKEFYMYSWTLVFLFRMQIQKKNCQGETKITFFSVQKFLFLVLQDSPIFLLPCPCTTEADLWCLYSLERFDQEKILRTHCQGQKIFQYSKWTSWTLLWFFTEWRKHENSRNLVPEPMSLIRNQLVRQGHTSKET